MKAALLMSMIAAMMLCGCDVSSETAAQTPVVPITDPSQPSEIPGSSEPTQSLPPATGWRTLYRDEKKDAIRQLFERAKELTEKQGSHGELDVWSSYFGPWVIVEIKPEPQDAQNQPLDATSRAKTACLVDMAHETIIERGNWQQAKPFFDAQIAVFNTGFRNSEDKAAFIGSFAASVSAVGFGHTQYLEKPRDGVRYPRPVTGPSLKIKKDHVELIYYIRHDGMIQSYTRCIFTMNKATISFQSDPIEVG